jgi:hypothetical protein
MICSSGVLTSQPIFYQGKSITLYLGYPPGGAYDFVCHRAPSRGPRSS